jgi:dihydrofolate reductase
MSNVTCHIAISLDGYTAGPNQSMENPIGEGGMRLHQWAFATDAWNRRHGSEAGDRTADSLVADEVVQGIGAYIMGRNMFGPGRGAWDLEWRGWWGEDPPFHTPVYVLTHHPREPLEMQGGTTFHFVTDGIEAALEQAKTAAGDLDVGIGGGADVAQQYLRAGLVDTMHIHVAPLLLGGGTRLFGEPGGDPVKLEPVRAIQGHDVVHLTFARPS